MEGETDALIETVQTADQGRNAAGGEAVTKLAADGWFKDVPGAVPAKRSLG
ncbi:hypothetical protein ABZ070_06610 [Streptomyces sp. NPDC006283]|uniref:hypothetical protein n=1 Tax=Streptomyces sp. NPDC006283 TaxID=3156741 RepID=UPI0033A1B2E5